ncbi:MAG TPA: hypothetical protein VGH20_18905 [Myxococcales bacterium]|jgi:hypothetical protein
MTPTVPRQRRLLRKALSSTRECATLLQLERLGEPDARVWEHVASCARCQAEWTILSAFESATPLPGEEQDVNWISRRLAEQFESGPLAKARPRFLRSLQFRGAFGFASAALVIVAATVFFLREGSVPDLKPLDARDAYRSEPLFSAGPTGDQDTAPADLRWAAVPGAASYSVRLMEVDRAEVWTDETSATVAALPPDVLARVVPGKPMLWQVTAKDGKGFAIVQSQVQRFKVRNKGP